MPKVQKFSTVRQTAIYMYQFYFFLTIYCLPQLTQAQSMLGYSDPHGNFYVYDTGRNVHLEHQQIANAQFRQNSLAYISSTGELKYYTAHTLTDLDISNPRFYLNTDYYLYYSTGYDFSLYNGSKKQHLGILQNNPYAFSDSIAGMHDFAEYFYAYWNNKFIELEPKPVRHIIAGDNILAYIDDLNQTRVFYHNEKIILDNNPAYYIECGANTAAFIDNYKYLQIFWQGKLFEIFNMPVLYCANGIQPPFIADNEMYCESGIALSAYNTMPLFKTGDDIVAFIDDREVFHVFYQGITTELSSSAPRQYDITDNILWWIDDNDFFHIFYDGEDRLVETYTPAKILSDKHAVAYTDNYGRLKAFFRGDILEISSSIIQSFELNNNIIMFSTMPNKFEFYVLQ